jgi:hypothetical protein
MTNRYYILPNPSTSSEIWSIVVEAEATVRTNLQGNKMIVKLPEGDETKHPILNGRTEYTHSEMLQYLVDNDAEWNEPII